MSRCVTCKHWRRDQYEDPNIGRCLGIAHREWGVDLDRVPAIVSNNSTGTAFVTHGQFGCESHEPHPATVTLTMTVNEGDVIVVEGFGE